MENNKKKQMKIKLLNDHLLIANNKSDIYSLIELNLKNPDFDLNEAIEILLEDFSTLKSEKEVFKDPELTIKFHYLNALYLEYLRNLREDINYIDKTRTIRS